MIKVPEILAEVIDNDENLYEGNLVDYYNIVNDYAQNLYNTYHGFRHMFHVLWLCYDACMFYAQDLTARQMRDLLIAALFHDFDHSGMKGYDDLNVERAVRSFLHHILKEDVPRIPEITFLMKATEYPYKMDSADLRLSAQIIRDADVSQVFSNAWIQQVLFGLAAEWRLTPTEVLNVQEPFLKNLKFTTSWAQKLFPEERIARKIEEVRRLVKIRSKSKLYQASQEKK